MAELKPGNFPAKPWTSKELAQLRELAPAGADAIAAVLGRSVRSVKKAAHKHRISLRRPGERRGLVLGQPRGDSWKELRDAADRAIQARALREAILNGEVDPARLEKIARRAVLIARGAPLCPSCVERPQERSTTGLCDECHLRELARAHREENTRQDAQRELWRERQRKHRRQRQEAKA